MGSGFGLRPGDEELEPLEGGTLLEAEDTGPPDELLRPEEERLLEPGDTELELLELSEPEGEPLGELELLGPTEDDATGCEDELAGANELDDMACFL